MSKRQRAKEDPAREDRILFDIVVDAYNETERALGWYYHLEQEITFPFAARIKHGFADACAHVSERSLLRDGDRVSVVGLASEDACMSSVGVVVEYHQAQFILPLTQLECQTADESTLQAVSDWHYWCARGYEF